MIKYFLLLLTLSLSTAFAQGTGVVKGAITDESGALVPGAKVTASGPAGVVKATTSGNDGSYILNGLPAGKYSIQASSPGLSQIQPASVDVSDGPITVNIPLRVVLEKQEVTVQENTGPTISVDPSQNAGALVLRGADLDALSDDPDDLQSDLQALAGPAAGPNGGQIYIDGFTGGQLPNKDAIREIRINQNPFSPEYDKIGFGRIEILTKPGTDKFRGTAYFNYGNDIFNTRNPFSTVKPPFDLKEFGGNLSGPLSKKASFFLDLDRRLIDNSGVVNGTVLDAQGNPSPFSAVLTEPYRRLRISPRLDYQLNSNNTLTMRYAFTKNSQDNQGVGGFNLASRAYDFLSEEQTVQMTETSVLSTKVINETHFQYLHDLNGQTALTNAPSINVLSSFNGGGSGIGRFNDVENHFELQNYTSIAAGVHSWKFGVRARSVTLNNYSASNFLGTYTFGGGLGPDGTELTSIQRYQQTLLGQPGITPTQFSINFGNPLTHIFQTDVGFFVGDDWRVRPNLTLSLGLRYEVQTNIRDHGDFAPRIGFAWAPGSGALKTFQRPKFVIRGGFGIFYDRFSENNILSAARYDGSNQLSYLVINPNFFPRIPTQAELAQVGVAQTTLNQLSPGLRAPYVIQSAIGVERQLPRNTTIALTYTNTHGLHELLTRDINAPLPGTGGFYGTPAVLPYPGRGPIYDFESAGVYNQNQVMTNINSRMTKNISLFGFYQLNFASSNTDGLGTFPANQYNLAADYGPASTDVRNRAVIGGSITTWWDVRLNPFIQAQSGAPFNIITGTDLYGDSLFNVSRPGILPSGTPITGDLIKTPYGVLDPNPVPGETLIGRNAGRGPGQFTVNLRVAKTFGFGPAREGAGAGGGFGGPGGPGGGGHGPGGGGRGGGMMMGGMPGAGGGGGATNRRYNLTVALSARNLFNHVNDGPIIGNLTSPQFGQANSLAGGFGAFAENANNRRLELQARFSF
jgi:hypothetical protein